MKVTFEFPHEEADDAKRFLNAMDENERLALCLHRIKKEMDVLLTAVEHNNYASMGDTTPYVQVHGVDVSEFVPDANLLLTRISEKVNKIMEEL